MTPPLSIERAYAAKVGAGNLRRDPAQERIARMLDETLSGIKNGAPLPPGGAAALWRKFTGKPAYLPPKGAYIYGAVGRGKTMLMDLFVECAAGLPVRRAHFHDFMKDAHRRLRRARAAGAGGDPVFRIASDMAREAKILCFDEMEVHDVADAMLLGRLFERLFGEGVALVCTSNAAPEELYKEGLQREHILPFIDLLRDRCRIEKIASPADYRLSGHAAEMGGRRFFCPAQGEAYAEDFARAAEKMRQKDALAQSAVRSAGREVAFRRTSGNFLWTDFDELCRRPLGAGDYAEICARFSVIALEGVPVLQQGDTHPLLRFIHFIDVAYERRLALLWSAAGAPESVYPHAPKPYGFARMASRLYEMQSAEYIAAAG